MKIKFRSSVVLLYFVLIAIQSQAQKIALEQAHANGIYQSGEKVTLHLSFTDNAPDSFVLKIWRDFHAAPQVQKLAYRGPRQLLYNKRFSKPASLIFEVNTGKDSMKLGAIVDPEHARPGTALPADFDAYWKAQKQSIHQLPMEAKAVPVADNVPEGYRCFSMELNCLGPQPARGYFARPVNAAPHSLPIVLNLHAAGVAGDWCRSKAGIALQYAQMGKGALSFDLNAHGMLNAQPDSYYDSLERGPLANYPKQGLENREENYFHWMYIRLIRTLDYLKAQPEWDGKRILVIGESQGGGQALAAAGLDPAVSAVVATVPAMCDWGQTLQGRKGGWPNPFAEAGDRKKMLATLPYFDVAHILKNAKAKIMVEIGLIDWTCPDLSIYAAINQAKQSEKIVLTAPYRAHGLEQARFRDMWRQQINEPKMEFIKNYLQ